MKKILLAVGFLFCSITTLATQVAFCSRSIAPNGTPGTIDVNFADDGYLNFANVSDSLVGLTPQVVMPLSNGYQYVAFTDGTLIRLTNGNLLDTTYGPLSNGFATAAPVGVSAMIMDGNGCLVLTGTNGSYGWIARYKSDDSGEYDPTFNDGAVVNIGANSIPTSIVEQTLARLIVSGHDFDSGNGILWAFTNIGVVDTTFNANITPGYYQIDVSHIIPTVIADQYDRLIFANYLVPPRTNFRTYINNVGITRLTSSGELDLTFGDGDAYPYSGTLTNAITDADSALQIRLAFDNNNNIVVAAHTLSGISVAAYANTIGTVVVESEFVISSLTAPVLTNVVTTSDGKILLSGNQISDDATINLMWIARIQDNGSAVYELDASFNPTAGIMYIDFDNSESVTGRSISCIAIYGDGEISIVGTETDSSNSPTITPFMSRAYNNPYTTQEKICQNSKPIGSNDSTFGVTTKVNNGILFLATGVLALGRSLNQSAQAIALQDDQNIVVACNGYDPSSIIINMFDVDGLLNQTFNPNPTSPCVTGQAIVLDSFDNQLVQDMMTFSVNNVHKAILAGYVTNSASSRSNSLLLQYDLTPASPGLDSSFGGFNGDPVGAALGNGASQAYTLGRQSMGRIIVGGLANSSLYGLLQAYTSAGLLDQSFGTDGYYSSSDIHGIYATVIDSNDRVIIAYNNGDNDLVVARILADGSGLDTSFNLNATPGTYLVRYNSGYVLSNNSYRLALDQSGNIFIASVVTNNGALSIGLTVLDVAGNLVFNNSFDGSLFGGLTNFTITKLLPTPHVDFENDYLVLVGYDQVTDSPEVDQIMIASFVNGGEGWGLNQYFFNQANTGGYIKYAVGDVPVQKTAGAIIHPDGRIIVAGAAEDIPT